MESRIAVIGLGKMGGAVAARLAQSFPTAGFDAAESARAAAAEEGVECFDTLAAAVAGADIVLTSLPNSAIVRSIWEADDGLIASVPADATLVELSTIDPDTMRSLAGQARDAGHRVVDSPVSGGPGEARLGRLALLVGGSDEDVESARPALECIGDIRPTGDVGTGKVVKIVNNMMSMANVAAAAEAFAVGVASGVEPQRLFDVLSTSGGTSNHFVKRWPKALEGNWEPGFALELGEKDLALGVELARSLRMPAPVASTGRDLYQMAINQYAGKDIVAMLKLYTAWAESASN